MTKGKQDKGKTNRSKDDETSDDESEQERESASERERKKKNNREAKGDKSEKKKEKSLKVREEKKRDEKEESPDRGKERAKKKEKESVEETDAEDEGIGKNKSKSKNKNVYAQIEAKQKKKTSKDSSSESEDTDKSESGKIKEKEKETIKDGKISETAKVSKEKTKDLENYKGVKDTKGKDDKIEDTSQLDDAGKKVENEMERMLTVKDLVEMMNIMMISQKRLGNPHLIALGEVSEHELQLPDVVEKVDPEFQLKYDSLSRWCVFQGRIRSIDEFKDYDSFIKNYAENVHQVVKEFYRIFRISDRMILQNLRVIPPDKVGVCDYWNKIQKTSIIQGFYDNAQLFSAIKQVHGYEHRIFLNPCLSVFSDLTQRFLFAADSGRLVRNWVDEFVRRKQNKMLIGMNPVYGDTSTVWFRCCHPTILPQLLNAFPNTSYVSVMYGSQFSYPEIRLSVLDVSSLSAAMSLTIAADGMNTIVMASPTSANFDDFQRIILTMMFPIQVQVDIKYSTTAAPGVDACSALCAKLLLSSSPLSRNITKASCYQTDLVISNWLVRFGYQRRNINMPLELTYAPRGQPGNPRDSVWAAIATIDGTGNGWVNMGCDDFQHIALPLYNNVNRVPQYGGITSYFDNDDFGDSAVLIDNQIWLAIDRGLLELMSVNMKAANQMRGFLSQLRIKYLDYLAKLNRYIINYSENGFRLTDAAMNNMAIQDPMGVLAEDTNNPEVVTINSDSLFKFFKQLPNEFDPPQRITKQPMIESLVSQELQRVIAMYITISDRVLHDNRQTMIKSKTILKMVVNSSLVSPIAKSIIECSFRGYNISRMRDGTIREAHALRDDFFANFYSEASLIMIRNPEAFGLVEDIIRIRRPIERLNFAETERRSAMGIITSNYLPALPRGLVLRRYTLAEVREAENRLSLLTELYGDGVGVVSLPIPIRYKEVLCERFEDTCLPYSVNFYEEASTRFVSSETIEYGTFTAQFISPNPNPRPFPDQILMGADSLLFWKLGGRVYTCSADIETLFAEWFRTNVFSYEKYVKFANPLLLLTSLERS